jgi:hypothetical protein
MRASSVSASSDSVKSISLWELVNARPPPEPDYWAKKPSFWPKRPSLFARSVKRAKAALMALGILSIGALAGVGNYFLNDVSGTPLLATEDTPYQVDEDALLGIGEDMPPGASEEQPAEIPVNAEAEEPPTSEPATGAPPNERLAALLDVPETRASVVPPAILRQVSMFRAAPAPPPQDGARLPDADDAAQVALLSDDVPLPRARPDEPIFTGSIRRPASEPQLVSNRKSAKPSRWQRFGPCAALRGLRVAYLFGNRCGRYTRYDPPPPRQDVRVAATPAPAPVRQYSPQPYQPPKVTQD